MPIKNTLFALLNAAARKGLQCLLVGGNAVILLGFPRNTIDVDLLVPTAKRSAWLDLMRELKFRIYHGTETFTQFEPGDVEMVAVDLMFVDDQTWNNLSSESVERNIGGLSARLPRPEHVIALKLHAAKSPDRAKPEVDWDDIREVIRACELDLDDPAFQKLVIHSKAGDPLRWRRGMGTDKVPEMKSKNFVFVPFDLPVFEKPQIRWRPKAISWERVMEETEPLRRYYLEHFDSAEKRLRGKNSKPFRMD